MMWRRHQIVWLLHNDFLPTIDHIDGNRANDRIGNLRAADATINARNRRRSPLNKSGVRGVSKRKDCDRWTAKIGRRWLGQFGTFEAACAARLEAERQTPYYQNGV
jgi:hypothetical protein